MSARQFTELTCDHPSCHESWPPRSLAGYRGSGATARRSAARDGWRFGPTVGDRCPEHAGEEPAVKAKPAKRHTLAPSVRQAVHARSGGWCEVKTVACIGRAAHVHHRLPRSGGGTDELDNLQHTCQPCHLWLHTHPAVAYERGRLLRRGA